MFRYRFILFIIILLTAFDGVAKFFALTFLSQPTNSASHTFIALALHKNPGITFDIPIPHAILLPLSAIFVAVVATYGLRVRKTHPIITLGALAVILGATNNGIDRMINGFTTDYLMFFSTAILNISDLLILFGAGVIFMYHKDNPHTQHI